MRKLFKLKTILTIVLLIIAICTQVSNVLGAENNESDNSDVMPTAVPIANIWYPGETDYAYEYSSCGKNMKVPDYSDLVDGYNYYITDFYAYDVSNRHNTITYTKTLVVSNIPILIKKNNNNNYSFYNNYVDGRIIKSYQLVYSYSLDNVNKVCTLKNDDVSWALVSNSMQDTEFSSISSMKKHVKSNQDIYYNDEIVISSDSINRPDSKGNYYTFLENSANEIYEVGWKDKEYVSMGGMPNYQYIHVRKQLNVMKDEYFQFLFSGSFYGVDDKSKIMNVSIQLFDEEGNASDMIPVEYSYSKEKGLIIKQKVSKSPINVTQIELVVSLKDEYTNGSYGHMITEFDIASDSSGETNSWLGGIFDSITKLPELIVEGLSSLFQGIIDAVVGLGKFIVDGIVSFLQLIIDGIVALGTMIVDALQFVIDGLISLGTFIIDGLKSLFIPSDDFFSKYFSDLYDFFSNKLGILLAPFDVLITIVQKFLSISEGSGVLVIPNITILSYQLISAQSFDLKVFFSTVLGSNYNLYYAFVDCILAVMLMRLAMKKFNSIVGGGTSNDN